MFGIFRAFLTLGGKYLNYKLVWSLLMSKKKGFTLVEMMVVVLIIAVLASFAGLYYGRFVERMRIAEADRIIGAAINGQNQLYIRSQRYTNAWHKIDGVPVTVRLPKADNDYANGIENTILYTRGGALSEEPNAGFAITFETDSTGRWFAVARRVGHGGYAYRLVRPFNSRETICVPEEENEKGIEICVDYMGVDTAEELTEDPMVVEAPVSLAWF